MTLLDELTSLFEPALQALAPEAAKVPDYLAMIKPAGNADHGDYQANMAMALAKALGRKPPEVAAEIVAMLPSDDMIESATVAGPGFINVKLKLSFLAERVQATDARLGIALAETPLTIVIDYSSPNVAKPLHVGHLRSTVIGDALARINRFLGHRVITDNHLGDWGTQFGILLHGYKTLRDPAAYEADPLRELARLYLVVRKLIGSEDEDAVVNPIAEACRAETAKLHAGDVENVALWQQFMPSCMEEIHSIYHRLGVLPFDHEHGESFYNPLLPGVVEDLIASGVAETGDGGAIIVRTGKDNVSLIRKRDGAFTYTTSDLATIKYRREQWQPDRVLYVVDFRQSFHFSTLFAIAAKWGYESLHLTHVSFGSVLGRDGRPLQTRKGTSFELAELLDEAEELGLARYTASMTERKAHGHDVPELVEATVRDVANAIGIGAVKYADLCQNRTSDYKYDPAKMLATDGNTATYMQYAYARCRGILRESGANAAAENFTLTTPSERNLALQLLRFSDALQAAAEESLPHLLTAYLWDLAKAYSQFYEQCPVLKSEGEVRWSRLLLVDRVARTIQTTLDLLGIRVVERM